ncbi:SDR family NAD(P)-dependent oxidoreductase [Parvularcula dongshanensis]|uniref:Short-subunit dehydrogenase n=1 Tax=Parvularcula dongshanensis TaxID=1173995 RepID=A0A840I4A8_9PROT|nr:SDR family NAD(P)-dependent oxidoreductase [Parvularcula dongshanensis]MBB4659607.1 short-subunit dehydrogenase [Parvularcula dongshanensis]
MAHTGLAVVTGASTGIGLELAKLCAADGYELLIVANEAEIEHAADSLRGQGVTVTAVQTDLGTEHGLDQLWMAIGGRPVDLLLANAGQGLGGAFLDQDFQKAKDVIDLNVTGTTSLLHKVGRQMRDRNKGRILITGSIAGLMPGAFQAVYNGTKAYLDSLSYALRNELKETEVTVTCLMPGPTDTEFFDRAEMEGTPVGQDDSKEDPAKTAKHGYDAMMKGKAGVVSGFMNKVQAAFTGIIPDTVLAEMHRHMAEPGRQSN